MLVFSAILFKAPVVFLGHGDGVAFDPLGVSQQERFDTIAIQFEKVQKLSHRQSRHHGKVAPEQHAVETGEYAVNTILMLTQELFHWHTSHRSENDAKGIRTKEVFK